MGTPPPPPEEFSFPTEFRGGRGSCAPCGRKGNSTVGNAVVVSKRSLVPLWEVKWLGIGGSIDEAQWEEEAWVAIFVNEVEG